MTMGNASSGDSLDKASQEGASKLSGGYPSGSFPGPTGPQTLMPSVGTRATSVEKDRFIVCGLGSLGQQSVINLKKFDYDPFEVSITAIDQQPITTWEIDDLPQQLATPPILGDCRREDVLKAAGIDRSRAILIVTSDESTNVECAIAARRLNPHIQIILRSSRHSLNALLERQLGKFVALDATELPAIPDLIISPRSSCIVVAVACWISTLSTILCSRWAWRQRPLRCFIAGSLMCG